MTIGGVMLCSIAVGFFKCSLFGVDPFQCFAQGSWGRFFGNISYGTYYMGISILMLIIDLFLDKHYIGIATFINLFLTGYIVENYSQKIKINELADYVGVNRSYLASSFKKATGYSPQEYLLSIRMERAKSLLETTDLPVNTISNSVGYSDQLAFSRMFKRYAGVSPTTYREEHKL